MGKIRTANQRATGCGSSAAARFPVPMEVTWYLEAICWLLGAAGIKVARPQGLFLLSRTSLLKADKTLGMSRSNLHLLSIFCSFFQSMRRFFVCQKSSLWQRLISFEILDILQTDSFQKNFKDCNILHEISNADFCSRPVN